MCRAAIAAGVTTIVATPRWEVGRASPPLHFEECSRKVEHLVAETGELLSLRLGFVLQFTPDLPALVERYGSKLAIGGGRYLLISLSALSSLEKTDGIWDQLSRLGFSVLLARPECNLALRRDPAILYNWVNRGVILQIDAASIIGIHGRDIQCFARQCVQKYGHSVVVSCNARTSNMRWNCLERVRESLAKSFGAHRAWMLLHETPELILSSTMKAGGHIPPSHITQNFFQQLLRSKRKALETT